MQNIDYSRRLRGSSCLYQTQGDSQGTQSSAYQTHYGNETVKPKSAFILLIGAILLFTSGMVVGIQLNQKEKGFQSNQEKSFSNVGKSTLHKQERAEPAQDSKEETTSAATSTPFPTSLKFPPKNDQINYMIQIGNFSPEEAMQMGKGLMMAEPSLQGRLFRTSTGKLYAGYYYRMEDAREALEKIVTKLPDPASAMVKTIRF